MDDNNYSKFDCQQCLFKSISSTFISEAEFETVRVNSSQLQFKKGETILKQGARSTHLIFLHKGVIKFNYENEYGVNVVLTVVSGPKLLGGANLFFKETNLFSLTALEDCDLCLIDGFSLKNLLVNNGKFLLMLSERATEMFQASIFNFISLAHKQVNGRMADILIYLADHVYKNNEFNLSLSRKELAEFAACSYENVITTLSKFNKEGIISLDGKSLKIIQRDRLQEVSKHG